MSGEAEVSDRYFLYLDKALVTKQLSQLERPVVEELLRTVSAQERGLSASAKLPVVDFNIGGNSSQSNTWELLQLAQDTAERVFARYHAHLTREGRLSTDPGTGGLVTGERYELQGQIELERRVFVPRDGPEIRIQLSSEHWLHDDDAKDIPLALFGICLRPSTLHVMAVYVPQRERALIAAPARLSRRWLLIGAGTAVLAGGASLTKVLTGRGAAPTPFRVAGGPSEFFRDPEVREVFRAEGIDISQTEFGSAQIINIDRSRYDAVFPASSNTARQIQTKWGPGLPQFPSFGSPMAVMSWTPIVEQLRELGIAEQREGTWMFHVDQYLERVVAKTRWPGSTGRLLLHTTDPVASGSAQMLVAILARVANGNSTVTSPEDVPRLAQVIRPCFDDLGLKYETTSHLLRAYGEGHEVVPMAFAYENDAVHEFVPGRQMVFLYPTPNVRSEHHFIVLNGHPEGERVGDLLRGHPPLTEIAQRRFGFRYGLERSDDFVTLLRSREIVVPANSRLGQLGIGEIPSEEILGRFIDELRSPKKSPA